MAYNNVPVNGWPQIKDLERLDKLAKQIENMPTYTSVDRDFLDEWEANLPSLAQDVSDMETTKANRITIAPTFNAETAYNPGDLVYYNGLTYRCTNAHEGEWDADDFAATTIDNEINSLNNKLTGYLNTRNVTSAVISSIIPGSNVIPVNFSYAIPQGMKPRFIGYNGNDKTLNVVPVNTIQPLGDNDTQANIAVFNPTDATYTDVTVYACLGLVKA